MTSVSDEAQADFEFLMTHHREHAIDVELWKKDFREGILFLDDFLRPEEPYPLDFILHAVDIYRRTMGMVPSHIKRKLEEEKGIDKIESAGTFL